MLKFFGIVTAAIVAASTATAQDAIITQYDGSFDDATFAVESAIIGRGLLIDHTSHVGEMLERTGKDLGASEKVFEAADVYLFCSAVVSREVMLVDPLNIVHCPYTIFVAETGDGIMIGHRAYPQGAMQRVQTMLEEIVSEAVEF